MCLCIKKSDKPKKAKKVRTFYKVLAYDKAMGYITPYHYFKAEMGVEYGDPDKSIPVARYDCNDEYAFIEGGAFHLFSSERTANQFIKDVQACSRFYQTKLVVRKAVVPAGAEYFCGYTPPQGYGRKGYPSVAVNAVTYF